MATILWLNRRSGQTISHASAPPRHAPHVEPDADGITAQIDLIVVRWLKAGCQPSCRARRR